MTALLKMSGPGRIHIGTSGWHYGHWKGPLYPENLPAERFLEYYAGRFRTVEVNNTFYRMPEKKNPDPVAGHDALGRLPAALEQFLCHRQVVERHSLGIDIHDRVGEQASRYLTHMKKLKDAKKSLRRVVGPVKTLFLKHDKTQRR